MIILDTNVLVRLLVEDDEEQTHKALGILRICRERRECCVVTLPTLCELLWVLRRAYKVPRSELALVVKNLLDDDLYHVDYRGSVQKALERFRAGRADFADYLIGARGRACGGEIVYTFDQALDGEEGFKTL